MKRKGTGKGLMVVGSMRKDGTLPEIKEELGEVDGIPALITDLKVDDWEPWTKLWLYTAVQTGDLSALRVLFSKREVPWDEATLVDGHYVLKGEEFSDEKKGWALVLARGERCSPQTIVTHCTLYQEYMTEDALQKAADSYGGLTGINFY